MAEEQCRNCGAELPDGTRFCTRCGTPVSQQDAQQPPPGAEQPPHGGGQPPHAAGRPPRAAEQPPHEQPPYGHPPSGAGQPPYGGGQPPYGQPPYGAGGPAYGQSPYAPPPYGHPAYVTYAGFWRRFVAIILDAIILGVAGSIFRYAIFGPLFLFGGRAADSVWPLVSLVIGWLYYTLMEASSGRATLGKMALGIVVTDMDGNRISWARANARYWSKYLSTFILMIGWLMAGFTQKKQALHDMIAGTLVVLKGR